MRRILTVEEASDIRTLLVGSDTSGSVTRWACCLLDELHSGHRELRAMQHPLGFVCVQVYRAPEWGLCLHIWEQTRTPHAFAALSVHSHTWDLVSHIVCGQLENGELDVTDADRRKASHRVMEITSIGDWDFVRSTDRLVRSRPVAVSELEIGEVYRLPAGIFHTSRPLAAGVTATVVLADNRLSHPELALGGLDAADQTVKRVKCEPIRLRRLIGATIDEICLAA